MNRINAATTPAHFKGYKNLTVDDVLPTETTRLYHKLFSWRRSKRIPVKDLSAAGELNAFLINPAYLKKAQSMRTSNAVAQASKPAVIQYSQITRSLPWSSEMRYQVEKWVNAFYDACKYVLTVAVPSALLQPFQQVNNMTTGAKKYTIEKGFVPLWRAKVAKRAGGLAVGTLLLSGFVIGSMISVQNTAEPKIGTKKPAASHQSTGASRSSQNTGNNTSPISLPMSPGSTGDMPLGQSAASETPVTPSSSGTNSPSDSSALNGVTNTVTPILNQPLQPNLPASPINPSPAPAPLPSPNTQPVGDVVNGVGQTLDNTVDTVTDAAGGLVGGLGL